MFENMKNEYIKGLPEQILWHDEQPFIHAMGLVEYIYGMLVSLDSFPSDNKDEEETVELVQHIFASFSMSIANSVERSYIDRTLKTLEDSL